MSDTKNPYAAPTSNVASDSIGQDISSVKAFKRFTTWGVLGLAIITMGIYAYYWMYTRTKILNSLISKDKMPSWIVPAVIVIGAINLILSLAPYASLGASTMKALLIISTPLSLIGFVLFVVWAFMFRSRLNLISGSSKGNAFWLGPILTFFFQLYYFQYKINQMHDACNQG